MAKKPNKFVEVKRGVEAVIAADYFGLEPKQAEKGKAVLAIVNYSGGKIFAGISPLAAPHLLEAAIGAMKLVGRLPLSYRIREKIKKIRVATKNLFGAPREKLRLKPGEMRLVRADITAVSAWKDTSLGRTAISVLDEAGGTVVITLPDKSLSGFASAAFQAIRLARSLPSNQSDYGPIPAPASIVVIPDQISVMTDPQDDLDVAPGQSVIAIWIGGVPLYFGAHREIWKQVLGQLSSAAVPRQRMSINVNFSPPKRPE